MFESFLVTTVTILITWTLMIFGLTGSGLLVLRLYGLKRFSSLIIISSFWIGFAGFLCVGQIWNLFLPADGYLWLINICLSILGFVLARKLIRSWILSIRDHWKSSTIFLFVLLVLAIQLAFLASKSTPTHDTGSYHLSVSLWLHDFPIVPGLSNLHSRMGFNSSLFTFSASLSEWIWTKRPHHIMMGPLILMTYLISFYGVRRIIFLQKKIDLADVFAASLIIPAYFIYHWMNYAASLSPNGVVFFMLMAAFWLAIQGIYQGKKVIQKSDFLLFASAVLFACLITVKITVAVFAFLMWGLIIYWLVRSNGNLEKKFRLAPIYWIVVFTFLLIGPWLVRGIILSGYPFYPITFGGVNVDWKVPEIQANLDADWTRSYSRDSFDKPPESFEWVGNWFHNLFDIKNLKAGGSLPIIISFIAGIILLPVILLHGKRSIFFVDKKIVLIFISLIVGIIVWFFTAPDMRFGIGYFWLITCLLISLLFYWFLQNRFRNARLIVTVVISLFILIFLFGKAKRIVLKTKNSKYLTWSFKPNEGFNELLNQGLSQLPVVRMRKYTTTSGLILNVPIEGNQVWDAPLLSTPHPSPGLMLRNPKKLSDGFKSVGEWRPYGYPILMYPWHNYVKKRLDKYYSDK